MVLGAQNDSGAAQTFHRTDNGLPGRAFTAINSGSGAGIGGESATGIGVIGAGAVGGYFAGPVQLRLSGFPDRTAPTLDTTAHKYGEIIRDGVGDLWLCVADGTPGTFRKLAGPGTAGALHLFDAPLRSYDSRYGTQPDNGPKTKLVANTARTILVIQAYAGATAVLVNCLLVNALAGNGNFTIWSGGVARPLANTMVWGGNAGRFSTLAVSAVSDGNCQVQASLGTDLVIDVVGYYR